MLLPLVRFQVGKLVDPEAKVVDMDLMPVLEAQLLDEHHHNSDVLSLPDQVFLLVSSIQLRVNALRVNDPNQLLSSPHLLGHRDLAVVV